MEPVYEEFLSHLDDLANVLEQMTDTAKAKAKAARTGDLVEIERCMKQEQVYSLTLRRMDQQRDKMLKEMGLEGTAVSQLADNYPEELRTRAAKAAERAQNRFELYMSASTMVRTTMECALRDIDRMFPEGAKPAPAAEEPPPRMKTDFRA